MLDEGCNSTCHSKAWAVDAEARLARLGYSMPLKDDSCKSFAGLGSGDTKTEGVRSIPFSLLLPDGNMNGELDSYQLSTGNSPLLLSLHAQTKLGLVKDLAKGVVSIQDQPLNIKRCSKSGLLVMNLTEGLTDIINTPPNELPKIPKCHTKYNLAYTASTSDSAMADHDQTGFHSRDYDVLQSKLNEEQLSNRQVIIVTRGRRFQRHAMRSNRATLSINCEDIYDPDQDVSLRAHVGWHHRILETLSKVDKFNEHLNSILEFVTQHQEERILVDLECKSGRHRSVGQGFAAFRCLKALGYNVVLIHSSSWMWGEMRCGGVCSDCRNVGASVGQIKHLIPKTQPTTIRPRGSVAASRAGVGDAPVDSASMDHPTTNQIEEIRRLVQGLASDVGGLASDVGHLRSEQRKIAERRSRSPLRRRRLPTPPSPPRRRRSPSFSRKLPPWRHPQTSRGRSLGRDRSPSSRPAPSRPISSRPAPRSPDHPPPHISDVPGTDEGSRSTLPRRSREPPNDRDELERLVRNNLALHGPFDNKNISVTSLDGELLSEVVSFCVREGNRDRLFWICRPGVEDPHNSGVRMNVLIRDHIRPNRIIKVANSIKHWKRSTRCRPRNGGGWELIEDNVDGNTMVRLENSWIDVVVFHHPPGVFDDSGRGAYMSIRVKLTPNKKLRDVRDDFEKSLNPKVEMKSSEPKRMYAVKSKPQPKVLTPKLEQDDSDSYEYDYEYSPTGFMAVRFDSNVDLTVHPDERRTMSKKHRKMVLEGINNLNNHDRVMQSSLGMQPQVSNGTSGVAVITSHPTLFQDLSEHTYDVGVNAAYLDGDAEPRGWSDMFEGCTLIIVAIEYSSEHYPLCHGDLVFELEQYCDATGCRFLIVDVAHTERWESFKTPQIPYINEVGLAFVSNDDELIQGFQDWSMYRQLDDVLNWEFCQWIRDWSLERELEDQMSVAFPAEIIEEAQEHGGNWDAVDGPEDVALQDPVEDLTHEETLLDDVDIPGLPEDETERRRSWRKLPQRVRIAVRRLHRAFGHVPKSVMVNLVRAAKVSKEFVDAVKLHRCETCEKTSAKKPTHKVTLPSDYTFNHTLGIDVLELTDVTGQKYQVLNMVCIGTCFQQAEVVKVGAGQASSRSCLDALIKRWFSWAGHPVAIMCDRGLHNRGVLQQYMDEHNIQVHHVPLESPESLGRVERHGGLLKALFRRVCTEVGACTKEQVESCITQVLSVKNDSARVGGFSPSQWVLGRAPRGAASLMSEEDHAQLGAIQARHDPSSIFALQHLARIEAQKAFVHLDCSRRVQRALTRNASVFDREFNIGDLVTFRRDNQRGGTSWSPTCRVIGHENQKNIWLLCGNVPVLVASHNIRIASPSEALAQSVLNGEPVIPYKIINDTGQQAFLDARQSDEVEVVREGPRHAVDVEVVHEDIADSALPPIPEEPDDEWDIRPGFFEEDEEEDTGPMEEDIFSPSRTPERRVERPRPGDGDHERNVRPRVESHLQPESERGSSLVPSRRDSFVPDSTPSGSVLGPLSSPSASSWPLRRELLNDLPTSVANTS